ncbi:hypothetical protein GCM10028803_05040 [Larkinella knui]|uniref:Uncharacterized protein n=1 Tax=Larkinella knui TaxID=2025310 RepID=A0A3P1CKN5_9BACT|nr:hypothetical protein [Larkinella knui]RRB13819.1 hypothetical protein EHT87_16300 [Larkinella knui]
MGFNTVVIKAMIDAGIISAPPAKINTAESMRNFLKAFVDQLAAQDYTPEHDWNGTKLRFTRADGTPGNYVELRGLQGLKGDTGAKGDTGTLTSSALPARTTPINRALDKLVVQRGDGVLEKVNLYQMAGGQPLVTGNLVANGNSEFGDLSNMTPSDPTKLIFDPTQSVPAGGKGAFKYTGLAAFVRTTDLIPVNLLRRHRISMVARTGDANGANYDANARGYFGIICYDADGLEITPPHFAKVSGAAQTTLAVALNPGDTTLTLTSAAGWHTGATAANRGFAWYPYTNALGQLFPDYGYSRNLSSNYPVYWQSNGGTWLSGGIAGNVITLRSPWAGPALAAGTKVANVMEGGTYLYSSALINALVPNAWTLYDAYIQGVNPGNTEDPANMMFRPGTAFIRPIILINYNAPAASTTFYFTMLDIRESSFDPSTLLAANNAFTGLNTFSADQTIKRIIASGTSPSAAAGTGAGSGGTVSILAGSTDMAGTITVNIGTSPPTNQLIATITFSSAFAAAPKGIVISARNNQTGMAIGRFYINAKTASTFTLFSTDVAPAASTTYLLDYIVIA